MSTAIHPDEIKRLSAMSILHVKGTDLFHFHVVTNNGELTAAQTCVLAEIAETYGSGGLAFSVQSTITVRAIPYEHIATVLSLLEQADLMTGGTGSRVHPIAACRGTSCRFGLCDTMGLYHRMHERLYLGYRSVDLPHKFKIAVGGCPNNCAKPNLSDLGVMGQVVPGFDPEPCRSCANCSVQSGCPAKAAAMVEGTLRIDPETCTRCGYCIKKCPFGAVTRKETGLVVYIGGRSGKKISLGRPLPQLFSTEEEALDVLESAILLYREQGLPGERFADTIDRLGFEAVQEQLLSGWVLARKAKILSD